MPTTTPYADPGRASFERIDEFVNSNLLAGPHPELKPAIGLPLANDTNLAQFSVVGRDGDGKIAMATTGNVDPADDIQPIGVVAHAVSLGAAGSTNAQVFYSGCFNKDHLVWDDSFDTDAKKLAAFNGAPTPTTIIVSERLAY